MEKNENMNSGMQEMSHEDLVNVTGGETRRVVTPSICPICGEEITVPLSVHLRGHALVPCPKCGNMMPAGKGSTCYHCGYTAKNDDSTKGLHVEEAADRLKSIIMPDSKS